MDELWYIKCMRVGLADAKKRFSELVRLVETGVEVVITVHDRPVARLCLPVADDKNVDYGEHAPRVVGASVVREPIASSRYSSSRLDEALLALSEKEAAMGLIELMGSDPGATAPPRRKSTEV